MKLELNLQDFSISSSIFYNYIKRHDKMMSKFKQEEYLNYLNSEINMSDPCNYTFHYIDFVESTIKKQQCYNKFSTKAIEFIKKDLNYEIKNIECLYGLFLPLFMNPSSFLKNDIYNIDSSVIHKNLTLLFTTNSFNRSSELFEIYSIYNSKYGIPLISKDDKQQFLTYIKAS